MMNNFLICLSLQTDSEHHPSVIKKYVKSKGALYSKIVMTN